MIVGRSGVALMVRTGTCIQDALGMGLCTIEGGTGDGDVPCTRGNMGLGWQG